VRRSLPFQGSGHRNICPNRFGQNLAIHELGRWDECRRGHRTAVKVTDGVSPCQRLTLLYRACMKPIEYANKFLVTLKTIFPGISMSNRWTLRCVAIKAPCSAVSSARTLNLKRYTYLKANIRCMCCRVSGPMDLVQVSSLSDPISHSESIRTGRQDLR
jgi:hypothetical protein